MLSFLEMLLLHNGTIILLEMILQIRKQKRLPVKLKRGLRVVFTEILMSDAHKVGSDIVKKSWQ